MKIELKRVVREMDLAEYQPEYAGQTISVWVNPPVKVRNEHFLLLRKWQDEISKTMQIETPVLYYQQINKPLPEDLKPGSPEEIEASRKDRTKAMHAYWGWFAKVWEGDSEEDVIALGEKLVEQEPGLWDFLRKRTITMIGDYAKNRKKA